METYGEDREHPLSRVLQAYRFLGLEDAASIIARARQEHEDFSTSPDPRSGWAVSAPRQLDVSLWCAR